MIRVEEITVHEFRGIRELTLDLKGSNFAVCGPNGTGKSGIVDALEFALTGNISRLSGAGTGGLSVKEHGPHVDSRNKPDQAYVTLKVTIPSLGKQATIHRSVKDAKSPTITPDDADVRDVFDAVALHPEFVLSRRELIRYVLSEPGKRSKEVQALLRLDEIETLRAVLQKIANASSKTSEQLQPPKRDAGIALATALQVTDLNVVNLLAQVNARRAVLSLPEITALTATTSLKDGLASQAGGAAPSRVPKVQAESDLKVLAEALEALADASFVADCNAAKEACEDLAKDPAALEAVSREALLRSALKLFDGDHCPVCDTAWAPEHFKQHVDEKLEHFAEVAARRKVIEEQFQSIAEKIDSARSALAAAKKYGPLLEPAVDVTPLGAYQERLVGWSNQLGAFVPLSKSIDCLSVAAVAPDLSETLTALAAGVAAIPEPTEQEAARDYLLIGQEKLERHRTASLELKRAQDRAAKAAKVLELYGTVTTAALDAIYKEVETAFSDLYREVNRDDESAFTAQLTPSIGKLGFDVDFYGRGHFPPGAYHSEGHQDGMGLCLYLALMGHLQKAGFTFAVLDDVLMSVDSGHRREVCNLLRAQFPDTQFIVTTHDEIWLRHMKTAGLIQPGGSAHFRKWTVDLGPTEWDDKDVWDEIEADVASGKVQAAAGTLRHYLEYFAREICHRLRAKVEFHGDAQHSLGDLLLPALAAVGDAFKQGKKAANSWGNQPVVEAIAAQEAIFAEARKATNVDEWQLNKAVHYNEWASLHKADFEPVVAAFKQLVSVLKCQTCSEVFYITPAFGNKEAFRCRCGIVNVSLLSK